MLDQVDLGREIDQTRIQEMDKETDQEYAKCFKSKEEGKVQTRSSTKQGQAQNREDVISSEGQVACAEGNRNRK